MEKDPNEFCYTALYHDCSDLSHVLVFTITWKKDIMV